MNAMVRIIVISTAVVLSSVFVFESDADAATVTFDLTCCGQRLAIVIVEAKNESPKPPTMTAVMGTRPGLSLNNCARICGQHHFNWYQQVVTDTNPPRDAAGNQLRPPYDDPPPGGYPGLLADNLPYYWNEWPNGAPVGQAGYDPKYDLMKNIGRNDQGSEILSFLDSPRDVDGVIVEFKTWLASVNKDGSLHGYHGGFSWRYIDPPGIPAPPRVDNVALLNAGPNGQPFLARLALSKSEVCPIPLPGAAPLLIAALAGVSALGARRPTQPPA
jgi:hypothetical protein